MDECCDSKAGELAKLCEKQGRVLYIVLAINAVMFIVEFTAGWILYPRRNGWGSSQLLRLPPI